MTASGPLQPSNRIAGTPTRDGLIAFFAIEEDEQFLTALPERDQRLVRLVVAGYTYPSIARELGITKQRVSQVARHSLATLEGSRSKAARLARK